jgi:hypothetical protein
MYWYVNTPDIKCSTVGFIINSCVDGSHIPLILDTKQDVKNNDRFLTARLISRAHLQELHPYIKVQSITNSANYLSGTTIFLLSEIQRRLYNNLTLEPRSLVFF